MLPTRPCIDLTPSSPTPTDPVPRAEQASHRGAHPAAHEDALPGAHQASDPRAHARPQPDALPATHHQAQQDAHDAAVGPLRSFPAFFSLVSRLLVWEGMSCRTFIAVIIIVMIR
jgi:hypothetical protein